MRYFFRGAIGASRGADSSEFKPALMRFGNAKARGPSFYQSASPVGASGFTLSVIVSAPAYPFVGAWTVTLVYWSG
jgi:hypothetical protein